jgi:hypothetical protein
VAEAMKVYRVYAGSNNELFIDSAEATVTAKQIMLDGSYRAWHYRRRFNKEMPVHKSERAALKDFMARKVQQARKLQYEIRSNQRLIEAARKMMEELNRA